MGNNDRAPLRVDDVETALRPFGQSRMLPREAYVDDGVLEWERRHVFDASWVCAGRADDVAEPGTHKAVRVGTTSVLLARNVAGALHAMANICRHRGHELLPCGSRATGNVIQCPYHGWSYELDGSLRTAPRFGEGSDFTREDLGLVRLPMATWAGWVFLNVDGTAGSLDEHLGTLASRAAPWECGRLQAAAVHRYEVAANWKLVIENYHECYHCPLIHPELCRVSPSHSGRNYREPGMWIGGDMELADHAQTMSLDGRSCASVLPRLDDRQRRHVLYVQIFPNLLVSLHPDYVMTHRVEPLTASTSSVECQWLFAPEAMDRPDFDVSYAVDFWDITNRQDWRAVESVQRNLASPKYLPGPLSPSEDAVYQFVTMMAAGYLGRPPS